MRCRQCNPVPEEVARAADLLGRRWMLAILWASAEEGAVRFNEFKQALEGIPPRTLAQRLAQLAAARAAARGARGGGRARAERAAGQPPAARRVPPDGCGATTRRARRRDARVRGP